MKKSTTIFAVISAGLFATLLFFSWLLQSTQGTTLLLKIATYGTPEVAYDNIQGHLFGKLEIINLNIHTQNAKVHIGKLNTKSHFNFKILTWIFDQVQLEEVDVQPYRFTFLKHNHNSHLPVNIEFNNIDINTLKISLSKQNQITVPSLHANLALLKNLNRVAISSNNLTPPYLEFIQDKANNRSDFYIDIETHDLKLLASGQQTTQWQVNWLLQLPDIKTILPKSGGAIAMQGNISGQLESPIVKGKLVGKDIQFEQVHITDLTNVFSYDFTSQNSPSQNTLIAHHLKIDDTLIHNFILEAKGNLDHHDIKTLAVVDHQKIDLQLSGKLHKQKWSGEILHLTWQNPKQQWQLVRPSMMHIDPHQITLDKTSLSHDRNQISAQGIYRKDRTFTAQLNANNLNLSFLDSLLGKDQHLDGNMSLNAKLEHGSTRNNLLMQGKISPGHFNYRINNETKITYFKGGTINALIDRNQALKGTSAIAFDDGNIDTSITLPQFNPSAVINKTQALTATVKGKLNNLHILENYLTSIKNLDGVILADYIISGTIAKPKVNGNIVLQQGSFRIPKANLSISNVNITARASNNNILYQGSLTSEGGTLSLTGNGKLENSDFPIHLDLKGSNLLAYNTPEIKVNASPSLHLDFTNSQLKLTGNIHIPEAKINLRNLSSTIYSSDDIIILGANGKTVSKTPFKFASSINLTLGDNIYLNFQGLKGQVVGHLRIEDDPARTTVAYGQLQLKNSTYSVYGNTLKIDQGTLNFSGGPIDNPSIDIRATRTIQALNSSTFYTKNEEIQVGVSVIGSVKAPKTNLFSIPAGKNPSDILSYLVLGVPASSATPNKSELLLQAANTLNNHGGQNILGIKERIQKSLGLSEMSIGTQSAFDQKTQETLQHTSFVLGKYLSPKFYVNYSLDFFDHTNTLKVRYLLNRFWTIQSVANMKNSGIDILYTVEK